MAACVLALALAAVPAVPRAADRETIGDVQTADALAGGRPSKERDQALARWAKEAPLVEVMYLLRRPSIDLSNAERPMLQAALGRMDESRTAMRQRLEDRLDALKGARRPPRTSNPNASVFRVAAFLPDSDAWADHARALRAGLAAGLRDGGPAGVPIAVSSVVTRPGAPGATLAALDSASARVATVVGGMLPTPTTMIATATRYAGVALVSPVVTDERVGEIGPAVFQIGPPGAERAAALAARVLSANVQRVGILVPSDLDGSAFVDGFARLAADRLVWRGRYASGDADFREESAAIRRQKLDLLLWDGDPREAQALLEQFKKDGVKVALCGGEGLAPDHHHDAARGMLEGAVYVAEEWEPDAALAARLDSLAAATPVAGAADGEEQRTLKPLRLRGYLAGRAIGAAVAGGALCFEELVASLASRTLAAPPRAGFLDVRPEGVRLPVLRVARGLAAELQ